MGPGVGFETTSGASLGSVNLGVCLDTRCLLRKEIKNHISTRATVTTPTDTLTDIPAIAPVLRLECCVSATAIDGEGVCVNIEVDDNDSVAADEVVIILVVLEAVVEVVE